MKPIIYVLEKVNEEFKRVCREMTDEEFAEYQEMMKMAESEE